MDVPVWAQQILMSFLEICKSLLPKITASIKKSCQDAGLKLDTETASKEFSQIATTVYQSEVAGLQEAASKKLAGFEYAHPWFEKCVQREINGSIPSLYEAVKKPESASQLQLNAFELHQNAAARVHILEATATQSTATSSISRKLSLD